MPEDYDDWLDWLDEEGFHSLGGDMYICPGDHVWHVDSVKKLYAEMKRGREAKHIFNKK